MMRKIELMHCWEMSDSGEGHCLLHKNHCGPHVFTPNGEMRVHFLGKFVGE